MNNNSFGIEQLKQYAQKIERLEEEKANLAKDIAEIYNSAKLEGFDAKIIRKVLRLRKMDRDDLAEEDELIKIYRDALDV